MATGQSPRRPADDTASGRTDPPHELSSAIHEGEAAWEDLIGLFAPKRGARHTFDVDVRLVQTSCGFCGPLFEHREQCTLVDSWTPTLSTDASPERHSTRRRAEGC